MRRKVKQLLPAKPDPQPVQNSMLTDSMTSVMPGSNPLNASLTPGLHNQEQEDSSLENDPMRVMTPAQLQKEEVDITATTTNEEALTEDKETDDVNEEVLVLTREKEEEEEKGQEGEEEKTPEETVVQMENETPEPVAAEKETTTTEPAPTLEEAVAEEKTTEEVPPIKEEKVAEVTEAPAMPVLASAELPGSEATAGDPPALDSADPEALLTSLSEVKPTQLAEGMNSSSRMVPAVQEAQSLKEQNELPVIQQPTGLPVAVNAVPVPFKPAAVVQGPDFKASLQSAKYTPAPVTQPKNNKPLIDPNTKVNSPEEVNTSMNVDTSMTPPPVSLQGEADPVQNEKQKQEADLSMQKQLAENQKSMNSLVVTPENMPPTVTPEELKPTTELSKGKELEPTDMVVVPLTPEMRTAMDEQMQEEVDGTFGTELTKFETSQQEYDAKSETAKTDGLAKISAEEENVKQQQLTAQEKGQNDIESHKETWKEENEKIKTEYESKAGSKRQETEDQIDAKVKEGELNIEKTSKEATLKAEEEKRKAEADAEKEKKKPKGFWDKVGDVVSAALDVLMKAVNFIYDKLKEAVNVIIAAAKKAVNDIIDAVRDLAVGLIKAFGEALKVFVSIAFAAFPEVAKWVNEKIDQAVEFAVTMVNELAEGLKAFANAILDEIGKLINMYLTMMQDIYTGIFSALKALIKFNDVLDGLANLGKGFVEGMIQFPAQMAAEMLGTDMTEPIPNMERTPADIEKHNKGEVTLNRATQGGAGAENALAAKTQLSDEDTTLPEGPLSIKASQFPDLPMLGENGVYELGGSNDPVTTEDMRANAFGAPQAEGADTGGGETMDVAAEEKPDADTAKWMAMDQASNGDDLKLNWFLQQMEQENTPNPADATQAEGKVEKPSTDSGYPYIAKTNPLGYSTRLGFAMKQMGVGLAAWWKQNQTAILLSMLGILIVGGVVAFFTGGAGLLPLAQVLMEVMTYYFMAQAIFMAKDHIKKFFELSWNKKPAEGGKELAKALAIIINEFLMEVILKKVGSVMKKVKDSIKATKTFAKVSRVTKKVTKAAGNLPGVKQLRGVGTKGGKYVIGSIRKQMAKGSKSLGDFRNKVLEAFGFKRMWLERHGDRMEMWGEFNSKVLITVIDASGNKSYELHEVNRTDVKDFIKTNNKGDRRSAIEVKSNQITTKKQAVADKKNLYTEKQKVKLDNNKVVDTEYTNKHGVREDLIHTFPSGKKPFYSKEFAGKEMPMPDHLKKKYGNSIPITKEGYMDFETYLKRKGIKRQKVEIKMSGKSKKDINLAHKEFLKNNGKYPPGEWTWHHMPDGKTMMLVPSELHNDDLMKHFGGDAITRAALGIKR